MIFVGLFNGNRRVKKHLNNPLAALNALNRHKHQGAL
jgi:hypothetical protein